MTNDFRSELYDKLKWLTFFRLLVTAVLLGGVAYIHAEYASSFLTPLLLAVYVLSSGVFVLTIVYSLLLKRITRYSAFATVQIILDTFIVSLMIYLTGGFSSGLSFLY